MEKLLTSRKGDMMKMKRVSDEWISSAIGNGLARSSEKIVMALVELQERRAAEKWQGYTDYRADDKNATDVAQESEMAILPIPCTRGFEDWTVKQWFKKINEELDEFKEGLNLSDEPSEMIFSQWAKERYAEEAADTITAITSMLEAMGIDERMRQEAQMRVNRKNRERGRL